MKRETSRKHLVVGGILYPVSVIKKVYNNTILEAQVGTVKVIVGSAPKFQPVFTFLLAEKAEMLNAATAMRRRILFILVDS
ncbi:MAG: hypothetical protein R2744_02220 [Bacteroidales bacterium]